MPKKIAKEFDYCRLRILESMLIPVEEMFNRGFWDKSRDGWKNAFKMVRSFAIEARVLSKEEATNLYSWDTMALIDEIKKRISLHDEHKNGKCICSNELGLSCAWERFSAKTLYVLM